MLTEIKDRATGWIAWIIVIIISIPFALWGVNEYFAGGSDINVAVVNGEEIDQQTYRYSLDERRAMARRVLGDRFDPDSVNTIEFRTAVLDDLILQELLSQDTEKAGYMVGDEQLAQFIRTTPQFQRDGQFDQTSYQQAVRSLGYTRASFENYLRQQNIVQQVRNGLTLSSFVTTKDQETLLALADEQRVFDYASINPEDFMQDAEITAEEIEAYYAENPQLFTTPELVKIDYVVLSVSDFAEEVEISDEEIGRFFEDNKERYRTPAQRAASHILFTVAEDADDTTIQEALDEAQSVADRARSGEDFSELARTYSEDPGSAAAGGDLGTVESGIMVKPFEDALFAMSEGEISDPVRTRYGFHVIKLTELTPEKGKELDEVREEIAAEERKRVAESMFIDRAETFRNLVYEQPESLEPVVEELGLELQTSDWFSHESGDGIADNVKVRDSAFSDDVFIENLNSEAIELDINTLVALRKRDSQSPRVRPLEEVEDQIIHRLKARTARQLVEEKGQGLLEQLNGGTDWESVLSSGGLESAQATQVRLQMDAEPSLQVTAEIFRTQPPDGSPEYGSVIQADGTYVLFRLTEVNPGVAADADQSTSEEVNRSLTARRGSDYFLSYQRGLRDATAVEVFEENL